MFENLIALVKLGPSINNGTSSGYCSICLPDTNQDYNSNTICSVTGYSHPQDSNGKEKYILLD